MSVTSGGLIFKRQNNIKRPAFGVVPPIGGLTWYIGDSGVPVPPDTVMGAALTTHDVFVGLVGLNGPETFESFLNGDVIDGVPLTSNGNNFDMTSTASVDVTINTANGRFNTTPAGLLFVEADSIATLTFNLPINTVAFGMYLTDVGDFGRDWTLTIYDEFLNPTAQAIPGNLNGALVFIGFIDTSGKTYQQATLTAVGGGGDGIGVDDVHVVVFGQM